MPTVRHGDRARSARTRRAAGAPNPPGAPNLRASPPGRRGAAPPPRADDPRRDTAPLVTHTERAHSARVFDRAHRVEDASPAACRAAVDAVAGSAGVVALLVADQPDLDVEAITAQLGPTPVVGGVFPALIEGTRLFTHGALALAIDAPARRAVLPSTFEPPDVIAAMLGPALEPAARTAEPPTLMVLVDGYAAGAATALLDAIRLPYLHLGARVFGGGAGYAQLGPRACLFTERGPLHRGAGLVVRFEARCSVGTEHGWSTLAGPYLATKGDHTTVRELDWRPAREVYAEATGTTAHPRVSMQHPLAIVGPQGAMLVRDPLSFTEEGGIFTFGQVGQRALVSIMHADPDALIGAAGAASRSALLDASRRGPPRTTFVFDCVSRADTLGARFGEELVRIHREATGTLWGALSLGEISSTGERGVELHNKTAVVTIR